MTRSAPFVVVAVVALAACQAALPNMPVSPEIVRKNIHNWNGRDVVIEGWLGECKGYDCHIFETLNDAKLAAKGNSESKKWRQAYDRSIGIDSTLNFDELARPLQFQKVQISGRLSDQCRGLFKGCTDRVADILPSGIGLASDYKKEN